MNSSQSRRWATDCLLRRKGAGTDAGAKGAFTGDIEALLLKGEIDIAIHSMKDLTSDQTDGLVIGATPPRSDPRDALVTSSGGTIKTLPRGARVGTSSLRRKAQLLEMRQDLQVVELHGNVDTRLKLIAESEGRATRGLDAIVLAVAGLERLGEGARISQTFSIDEMVPAVGQGIIAVQMRRDDRDIAKVLSQIDDEATGLESRVREGLRAAAGRRLQRARGRVREGFGSAIRMVGMLAKEDGSGLRQEEVAGDSADAAALGRRLAEDLLDGSARTRRGRIMKAQIAGTDRITKVVITRSRKGNAELAGSSSALGFEPFPIDTHRVPSAGGLVAAWTPSLMRLGEFDWLLFTSPTGVESLRAEDEALSLSVPLGGKPRGGSGRGEDERRTAEGRGESGLRPLRHILPGRSPSNCREDKEGAS